MLTEKQKKNIKNMNNCTPRLRRSVRKRVTDKTARSIEDIVFVLEHAKEFPNLRERIPPDIIQNLLDRYFEAFKINSGYANPDKVIKVIDENAALKRENAALMQELGTMVHRVEHFKYLTTHVTLLLEKERQENDVMP